MSKILTGDEAILRIIKDLLNGKADIQTDNHGQFVIYTGLYDSEQVEPDGEKVLVVAP